MKGIYTKSIVGATLLTMLLSSVSFASRGHGGRRGHRHGHGHYDGHRGGRHGGGHRRHNMRNVSQRINTLTSRLVDRLRSELGHGGSWDSNGDGWTSPGERDRRGRSHGRRGSLLRKADYLSMKARRFYNTTHSFWDDHRDVRAAWHQLSRAYDDLSYKIRNSHRVSGYTRDIFDRLGRQIDRAKRSYGRGGRYYHASDPWCAVEDALGATFGIIDAISH